MKLSYSSTITGRRRNPVFAHELPESAPVLLGGAGGSADIPVVSGQQPPEVGGFKLRDGAGLEQLERGFLRRA